MRVYIFFSAFEQNYQEGLTGGAAGLAGVSGPPSVTKEVPTSLPERNITAQHESRLLEYLLTNYNRHVRPVLNHTKNVTVNVGITLTQIFDMVSIIIFLRFRLFPLFKKFWQVESHEYEVKFIKRMFRRQHSCGQMIQTIMYAIQKFKFSSHMKESEMERRQIETKA